MKNSVLIVDDDPGVRKSLQRVLSDEGMDVEAAASGEECLEVAATSEFACILLDVKLGDGIDGLETLCRLREAGNDSLVIMISGHGSIETAVKATRLGAYDFIEKPLSIENTLLTIRNGLRRRKLEQANRNLQSQLADEYPLIGSSITMRALRKQIAAIAKSDSRVLIWGESGSGKELVARALHARSSRKFAPFVAVNSAAIPDEHAEFELFGGVGKKGKFEIADAGTLFLDEIADMSLKVQGKILRMLDDDVIDPVGGKESVNVDVRIFSATNANIDDLIETGSVRPDLFYRLNIIPFQVPPLREHSADIPELVDHFNRKFSEANGKPAKQFTSAAIEKLRAHHWPGNVRELKNTVERIVIMALRNTIDVAGLPEFGNLRSRPVTVRFPSFQAATEAYQRDFLIAKLAEHSGDVSQTAKDLGIEESHLRQRMRTLGISSSGVLNE